MTDQYDLQVAALQRAHEAHEAENKTDALSALIEYGWAAGMDDDDVADLIIDYEEDPERPSPIIAAWSHGFSTSTSLFSALPPAPSDDYVALSRCLTMIKDRPDNAWHDRLGLADNKLIPGDADKISIANLPEFAHLRRRIDQWPNKETTDGKA